MNVSNQKHCRKFTINSFDSDLRLNLKINSLFHFLSEVAWEHAKELGVGFEELADTGKIWILSAINLKILKLPKWQDTIVLETWPSGITGLQYTREFKLLNEKNECLVAASSSWIIYDKQTGKPVLPEEFSYLENICKEKATDSLFAKIRPRKDLFPAFKEYARHTDIDMHQHVNNSVYVKWIENCMGDIYPRRINTFKIQYLHEVKENDEIVIFTEKTDNHYYWEARINGDKLCFRAEVGLY